MREYRGIPASGGIAINHAFAHYADSAPVPRRSITESQVESEWRRYRAAVERAAAEVRGIKENVNPRHTGRHQLLDAQLLMLHDPEMNEHIRRGLPRTLTNVEWILSEYVESMVNTLESSGDEYLAERSMDILDVSRRITNQLLYRERLSLALIDREVILVSPNLLPSEIIHLDPEKVRGIVLDAGGPTSHTVILARSMGIPAVVGLGNVCRSIEPDDVIIVDGENGVVIVDPDEETLQRCRGRLESLARREKHLLGLKELPARTLDGHRLSMLANIEIPGEIGGVLSSGAEGVGLFRSEFLFMDPHQSPDEDRQFRAYARILQEMGDKPVTIRTLDAGGDKLLPGANESDELNPLLGWRAIRFCLGEEELFRNQLRALLRASAHGNLRIMFPLISNTRELDDALSILNEEKGDLAAAGTPMAEKIPVGIMIEVPSAALIADVLARRADFFSIGTNDLIQYTMAVDRGNEKIADLYQTWHPAVWRLIETTVAGARESGIPAAMCGELAGDPLAAVLLAGLGLDELSMSVHSIPAVKSMVRSIDTLSAREALAEVLTMENADDVQSLLMDRFGGHLEA